MRRFLLTLDSIDILCLVYSNLHWNLNKLSTKYQSYPKLQKSSIWTKNMILSQPLFIRYRPFQQPYSIPKKEYKNGNIKEGIQKEEYKGKTIKRENIKERL